MITIILRSDKSNKTFKIHLHPNDPIEKIWSILKMNGENYEMLRQNGNKIQQDNASESTVKALNIDNNDVITVRKSLGKSKNSFEIHNPSEQEQRSKTEQSFISNKKSIDISIREAISDSAILRRNSVSSRRTLTSKSDSPVLNLNKKKDSISPDLMSKMDKNFNSGSSSKVEAIKEETAMKNETDQSKEISSTLPNDKVLDKRKKLDKSRKKEKELTPQWKLVCREELARPTSPMRFDVPTRQTLQSQQNAEANQEKFQVAELQLKKTTSEESLLQESLEKSEDIKFEKTKVDTVDVTATIDTKLLPSIKLEKTKVDTVDVTATIDTKLLPSTNMQKVREEATAMSKPEKSPSKLEDIHSDKRKSTDTDIGSMPSSNTSRRVSKEPMVDKEMFMEYLKEIEEKLEKKKEKKQPQKGILAGKDKPSKAKHVQIIPDKKIQPEVKKSVSPPKIPVKKAPSVSPPKVPKVKEPSPIKEETTPSPEKDDTSNKEVSPSVVSNEEKSEGSTSDGSEKQSPRNASNSPAGSNEDNDT